MNNFFKNAKTRVLRTLFKKYLVNDSSLNFKSGLEKVCNDGKLALLATSYDVERADIDSNCTLKLLDAIRTRHCALHITKRNPLREAMNRL